MPGLRLTVSQASLVSVGNTDVTTSLALLDALVRTGFLRVTNHQRIRPERFRSLERRNRS